MRPELFIFQSKPVRPKCGICKRRRVHPDGDPTICKPCQEKAERIWGGLDA